MKVLLEEQKLLLPYVHFSNLTSLSGINSVLSESAGQQSGKKTRGYSWKLVEFSSRLVTNVLRGMCKTFFSSAIG